MNDYPTALERLPDGRLRITWSDGVATDYAVQQLRDACPCATCDERRKVTRSSPSMPEISKPDELHPLTLSSMTPVGNYAYSITFSDGHGTGIYRFELLRELEPPSP